jgi:hypothetical protein
MSMTRIVLGLVLAATVAVTAAPAFAIKEYTNCSAAPRDDFARCVIRQSKTGGSN